MGFSMTAGFVSDRGISGGSLVVLTVHLEGFLHLFQYLRILPERAPHLHLVKRLRLVADPVFHCCPEIHGDCAELDLHGIIFHTVHIISGYTDDNMIAPVSVGLRGTYVVLLPDKDKVRLFFQ